MKVNFIYRSAPGNSKRNTRPEYFDKAVCMRSFIKACDNIPDEQIGDIIFLNDGELDDNLKELMEGVDAEIIQLGGIGNSGSLRYAHNLGLTREWNEQDLLYFAEDDYIYKEQAFTYLLNAAKELALGHYFTLYDHPDRYTRNDDVAKGYAKVFVSSDCHWRTVESTCQTYGARIRSFRKDNWIHRLGTSLNTPRGREMFRAIQGIGKYFWKFPKHKVLSPIPSLCTHMETEFLAKNVDWESTANKYI